MSSDEIKISFENAAETSDFSKRNQGFLKLLPSVEEAIDIAFVREMNESSRLDLLLVSLGRLCAEEFMEIMLLCANGYGIAATRLIRGMYERAVTASYLRENPSELEAYAHYGYIATYKLMKQIQSTMGPNVVAAKTVNEVEKNYEKYKNDFLVTDCRKCGTKKMNHTWSKLDFVSMAARTSLGVWIVPGYYLPTQEIHSTLGAISSRVEVRKDHGLIIGGEDQRGKADLALVTAFKIMLFILDLQRDHFGLSILEGLLQKCETEFEIASKQMNGSRQE